MLYSDQQGSITASIDAYGNTRTLAHQWDADGNRTRMSFAGGVYTTA